MRIRLLYAPILAVALFASPALASCPQPQFGSPIVLSGPGFALAPQAISSGDFNNDGLSDLLVSDSTGAAVFLADGSGHFMNQFSSGTANGPRAVVALDVNHDGNLDFAMVFSSNTITHDGTTLILHFGDGTGNFTSPLSLYQAVGSMENPQAMVASDFNGDGNMDLVVAAND
ncbi:MAG TPA: VCBS repeat-containing protein, partial [Candidatus Eisenbacteria bacterium]|nr:VCBS repeat-containing protein [Candidatus Eisenbacteria bacterium]